MGAKRVLDGFPGLLDRADCSFDRGMCYVLVVCENFIPQSGPSTQLLSSSMQQALCS